MNLHLLEIFQVALITKPQLFIKLSWSFYTLVPTYFILFFNFTLYSTYSRVGRVKPCVEPGNPVLRHFVSIMTLTFPTSSKFWRRCLVNSRTQSRAFLHHQSYENKNMKRLRIESTTCRVYYYITTLLASTQTTTHLTLKYVYKYNKTTNRLYFLWISKNHHISASNVYIKGLTNDWKIDLIIPRSICGAFLMSTGTLVSHVFVF